MDQGLLNYQPDPIAQGLIAFGGGLLTPRGQGGGIHAGLLGANQAMSQAAKQRYDMQRQQLEWKRQQEQDALKKQLTEAQIAETTAQAKERDRTAKAAQDKSFAVNQGFSDLLNPGSRMRDPESAMAYNANRQMTIAKLLQNGVTKEQIETALNAQNLGKPKVAGTFETADAQGRPVTMMRDDFGQTIGDAMPKPYERKTVDVGGKIIDRDPYTGQQLGAIQKSMTPDGVAADIRGKQSNAIGWAGVGNSRERLAFEKQKDAAERLQPKLQYDSDRGIAFDARSGEARPVVMGGQPLGPKEKPLTESQGKAGLFATRATEASRIIEQLEGEYSRASVAAKEGLSGFPLAGGAMAHAYNTVFMGKNAQKAEQAQRNFVNAILRQESGAVINKEEFVNARLQYFPQPGDDDELVAQKRQSRIDAINGLSVMAGPALRDNAQRGAQLPTMDAIDAELKRRGGR